MENTRYNKLIFLSEDGYRSIIEHYQKDEETFFRCIDGSKTRSLDSFLEIMEILFQFPWSCDGSIDRYTDFMTDLGWLGENTKKVILVIEHFNEFMEDKNEDKLDILKSFYDIILPFWEKEVDWIAAPGQRKAFEVYCIRDSRNPGDWQ